MTKTEFRKNFPKGSVVPPLLLKLLDFQEKAGDWYSGHFELTDDGQDTAVAWFDGDKTTASRFILFGKNTDGSVYGFWLYDGRNLENAPVVFLGSEGTGCTVLANSVEEFFSLLAVGEDELGFSAPNITEPEEPSENHAAFRRWLKKECEIAKPKYPAATISTAVRNHPDLQAWVSTWQKSHFPAETSERTTKERDECFLAQTEDVYLSDELKQLLGSLLEEVMKGRFSSSLAGNPKVKKQAGIAFSARAYCTITSIFLHSEGDEGFGGYKGDLPGGIAFTDSRRAVQKKLGKAAHSGGGKVIHPFGKMPAWDRYDYRSLSLHVQYAEGEKSIRLVTLMTPDAVPK